jgi:hypothetical protein
MSATSSLDDACLLFIVRILSLVSIRRSARYLSIESSNRYSASSERNHDRDTTGGQQQRHSLTDRMADKQAQWIYYLSIQS